MGNVMGVGIAGSVRAIIATAMTTLVQTASGLGITKVQERRLFEDAKAAVVSFAAKKLLEVEKEIKAYPEKKALLEASMHIAKQSVEVAMGEAEKLILDVGEQALAPGDTAMPDGQDVPQLEKLELARKAVGAAQEKVLNKLKEEGDLLQKNYDEQSQQYYIKLQQLKQQEDAAFLQGIEPIVRKPKTAADNGPWLQGGTEHDRAAVVATLVKQIEADRKAAAGEAMKLAEEAAKKASDARKAALISAKVALDKKAEMEDLIRREQQRRTELEQSGVTPAAEAQKRLPDEAGKMLTQGTVDIGKLEELAKSGLFVWCWSEDAGERFGAQDEALRRCASAQDPTVVLYEQRNWAKAEAAYHLWIESGQAESYRFVCVDVGAFKKFATGTGTKFTLDFKNMVQQNATSNFQRAIRRKQIASLTPPQLQVLMQQRRDAVEASRCAAAEAVRAWQKAELEESSARFCARKAEERIRATDASKWQISYPVGEGVGLEKIPMQWAPMGERVYMEVDLASVHECQTELEKVKSYFLKSTPNTQVVSIRRVQNLLLWHLYARARERVAEKPASNGSSNEELFFHGAGYCEKFASAGTAKLILARCILGNIGVDSTHFGGKSSGHVRRDDQTGGSDNKYIIPDNNHVYPAYVIEFKT